jgi:hypothetical protein
MLDGCHLQQSLEESSGETLCHTSMGFEQHRSTAGWHVTCYDSVERCKLTCAMSESDVLLCAMRLPGALFLQDIRLMHPSVLPARRPSPKASATLVTHVVVHQLLWLCLCWCQHRV